MAGQMTGAAECSCVAQLLSGTQAHAYLLSMPEAPAGILPKLTARSAHPTALANHGKPLPPHLKPVLWVPLPRHLWAQSG